jgi:hypothetical protein
LDVTSPPRDDAGIECADLEEAIQYAEEIAGQLRKRNPADRLLGRYIVVSDEAGNEVKRVPVIPRAGMLQ